MRFIGGVASNGLSRDDGRYLLMTVSAGGWVHFGGSAIAEARIAKTRTDASCSITKEEEESKQTGEMIIKDKAVVASMEGE